MLIQQQSVSFEVPLNTRFNTLGIKVGASSLVSFFLVKLCDEKLNFISLNFERSSFLASGPTLKRVKGVCARSVLTQKSRDTFAFVEPVLC